MSESVIADFVGKFNAESSSHGEPVKGRILLSEKRLVLAANDDEKMTIPLPEIFDIAVDHVPSDLGEFFESTVTVAFRRGGNRYVAVIEADDEKIDKFSTVLFKVILNGTEMTIRHPARIGGRVTDTDFRAARLFLQPRVVKLKHGDGTVDITLSTVAGFDRSKREIAGEQRPVLEVRHVQAGQSMRTVAATDGARTMSILGRYVRLEYAELLADLEDVELTRDQTEILVALYSGVGEEGMSLANVVGKDPSQVTMLLNRMAENDLVADTADGPTLTPKGQVVVSNHLEDVNT